MNALYDPVSSIDSQEHIISSIKWFENDTGIFFTGGFEGNVKLYDTNNMEAVFCFEMSKKVFSIEPGISSQTNHLIACAIDNPNVRYF